MSRRVVLHISGNSYPPLPADHHTLEIWRELSRTADEYHVIARAQPGHGASHTQLGNIHLHLLPSVWRSQAEFLFTSWVLPYFMIRCRPTLLLAQSPVLGGLAASACSLIWRVPLMVELHGEHYFRGRAARRLRSMLFRELARIAIARARRVRALSQEMLESIRDTFGARAAAKTVIVPTRVDLSVFGPAKADYATHDVLRLIAVGSFTGPKNHLALIEALRDADPHASLTLVGEGPLRGQYERAIEQLGLQGRVHLHPWLSQRDLASVLREHDVYVHYSSTEALSRSILEAMALGLPTVATAVGFVRGILRHGENALLLEQPWAQSLARALGELRASMQLRQRLGAAAHATIVEGFEWRAVFERYRAALYGMPADLR